MSSQPTLVVLGASGDLAVRLLFPALLSLEFRERLEDLKIIGYARQEWTTEQFHEHLRAAIDMHGIDIDQKYFERFIDRIEFHGGDISVSALKGLEPVLDGPAIFYLALPPGVFADAAEKIAQAGLADETEGYRRLVIEKPFGTDLESARELNGQLHRYWREDQIFRIDHFLGKETVQNMLVFRFANRFIEPVLNSGHVDEIQITVAETLGVEGRSHYYDGIGALRDMVQNHLIQMMTFATMEPPALWEAEMIRDHKVEVLKSVHAVNPDTDAVRGQYSAGLVEGVPRVGYRQEPGVDPTSRTDTFAAVQLHVDTWRWEGIPVLLRSGKRLAAKAHEVVFRFREPPTSLFRHTPLEHAEPNWLVFRMSPSEATELVVRTKQPGLELETRESVLRADYATPDDHEASAYESLLLDVLEGDHTPFLRFDEVEWSWRIVEPILKAWEHGSPEEYVGGSDGPAGQHRFLGPGHYWRPLLNAAK
ncbi:MAG: glucose-6-phosphate 1-dehydrogenase [Actinomycetota bacterium]|nr:glucose-6-phosphate 1-dehydrogenase [Actinomycetota bacterium]MDQ1475710.1 glucose-6-phosphate 1-dehydrogenase [Actinomycetota bacterium]